MDSNGGHYSKLYKKNTKKNKYWIVRFTDSEGRHRKLLLHQIDPALESTGAKSFVITQPQIVKYENFKHPYPYKNLRVHKDDRKTVKTIQNKLDKRNQVDFSKCFSLPNFLFETIRKTISLFNI